MTRASRQSALKGADLRHLMRRFAFAATPAIERALAGMPADKAVDTLIAAGTAAPPVLPPDLVAAAWTNPLLRSPGLTDAQYDKTRAARLPTINGEIDLLRQWWISQMIASPAPLRENLTLFFHGTFGSTTGSVDIPHALYGCNALLRRSCLDTIPALLERLVVDPAMMIQIGMDEHRKVRVSDRPAKLILDYWTVGPGAYEDRDVEALSRALTGWMLTAPPGQEPAKAIDPGGTRAARRTGLVPSFDPAQFDTRPKTILGTTDNFDARGAMRLLAAHPATARRFGQLLIRYFGIDDPQRRLEAQLIASYAATGGSMPAMLRTIALSDECWLPSSEWSLIKSPVHLAVGACRQLEINLPPLATIVAWLAATGQRLFDTPNAGEGGWPDQQAWMSPAERLAIRYQLPTVLSGVMPRLGLQSAGAAAAPSRIDLNVGASLPRTPAQLLSRLDPAPGIDLKTLERRAGSERVRIIEQIMMTPHYQLA